MPGMLPVINEECVAQAVRTGLGLKAAINEVSVFDRKNYFYPDLPQGYQISQYKQPIVGEGIVTVDLEGGASIEVGIERLHLEQDAGKSIHDQHPTQSLVDLNRSRRRAHGDRLQAGPALLRRGQGLPFQAQDHPALTRHLRRQHGGGLHACRHQRVRPQARRAPRHALRDQERQLHPLRGPGDRVRARRQIALIEDGGTVDQETRLYDAGKGETRSMRSKEEAHDYRYFPDRTSCRSSSIPPGSRASRPRCPNSRTRRRPASSPTTASRPTTRWC